MGQVRWHWGTLWGERNVIKEVKGGGVQGSLAQAGARCMGHFSGGHSTSHPQERGWRWQGWPLEPWSLGRCLLGQDGPGQALGGSLDLGKLPAEKWALEAGCWQRMPSCPPSQQCCSLLSLPILLLCAGLHAPGSTSLHLTIQLF